VRKYNEQVISLRIGLLMSVFFFVSVTMARHLHCYTLDYSKCCLGIDWVVLFHWLKCSSCYGLY
jgi:hypothetical protein